jgi:hypothetical protein
MTEYQFHSWSSEPGQKANQRVTLDAESRFHGAALALRQFVQLGCDISAPLAHIDVAEPDGVKHTLLVEEVLEWLSDANQMPFVQRENLGVLLHPL